MKVLFFALIFSLEAFICYATPLGFRDAKMGMQIEEIRKMDGMICGDKDCEQRFRIKNVIVDVAMIFDDNELTTILMKFDRSDFDTMKDALLEKWGKPTKSKVEIWMNKFGNKFDNHIFIWNKPDGEIKLSNIGESIDLSNIAMISHLKLKKHSEKKEKEKSLPGF